METILAEKDKIATEEKELVRIFNKYYINIVERSCGTKPINVAKEQEIEVTKTAVKIIFKSSGNHESNTIIEKYHRKNLTAGNVHPLKVSVYDVEKRLRNIDGKKFTGMDKVPPKLMKVSARVLPKPLAIAINNSFNEGMFRDNARIACVSP